MSALDRDGERLDFTTRGITAGTYQHECDHLDGVLFIDRVEDPTTFCTWKEFARHREDDFKATVEAVVARWGS